jgi:2-hydroxychromene-2-carboxylate isomerase
VSLRSLVIPPLAQRLLSRERLLRRRARAERRRIRRGEPHRIQFFHQVDDPHSVLAALALPEFARRYDVVVEPFLVAPPADDVAPERALLQAWARRDAALLARRHGLPFEDPGAQPAASAVRTVQARLVDAIVRGGFVEQAGTASAAAWLGDRSASGMPSAACDAALHAAVDAALAAGDARRRRLGHYLGGTFHHEGEWYWGVDRLHHLESRLQALGAARSGTGGCLFPPDPEPGEPFEAAPGAGPIDFFFSLRSPYSAIAAPRVLALGRAAGVPVRLRWVLPMVMRGLPVPKAKRAYIAADAAREAHLRGVPFGRVLDPVGRPTERGLALFPLAERDGRGEAYLLSAMHGIWAEGLDPGSDRDLRRIAARAGLDWDDCRAALADDGWRAVAEANRAELFAHGLWGVPSLAANGTAVWGQDRLWAIRDALRRGSAA